MGFGKKETPEGFVEHVHKLVRFTIPEKPTVRQQLAYLGEASVLPSAEMFLRLWEGAVALIEDWECKLLPDLQKIDIDELNDPQVTEIILWVGMECRKRMSELDNIPKN